MIRIWTAKTIEHFHKLRSVTGTVNRAKMASGGGDKHGDSESLNRKGETERRERSDLNKGVDGVAKPADTDEGEGDKRVLVQRIDPVTGRIEWIPTPCNYDYKQEIASLVGFRSSYADMLHDTERNEKYYAAISKTIQSMRREGRPVHVLDIGTGTGLLSLMAAAEGADSVTACEAFEPMANCAEEVIELNGYSEKIKVIHARSNEITIGDGPENKVMRQRATLLVTEVFDTELIGEGAIGTYTHALENLMEPNCLTVPQAATMYAQPVCSQFIRGWNNLRPLQVTEGKSIRVPQAWDQCGGAPSLHDLQLDQIHPSLFTPLSAPVEVFRFEFNWTGGVKKNDSSQRAIESEVDGQVDAVFVWWELQMDLEGDIVLSCAPRWAHPLGDKLPWRDHWMQAIFYPSRCLPVRKGETFNLFSYHDEYSLWFETATPEQEISSPVRPVCECRLHIGASRSRLGMLNDDNRNAVFLNILRKHVTSETVCAVIGNFSYLPLMAAMLGAKKVFVWEQDCTRIFRQLVRENELEEKIVILEKYLDSIVADDLEGLEINLVISEPYLHTSTLPWDNMRLWSALEHLQPFKADAAPVFPKQMRVKAMAMNFKDLWKIRSPVGLCQGFMLNIFDNMIKAAANEVDQTEEPQPLWEYPGIAMSQPITVLFIDGAWHPPAVDVVESFLKFVCEAEDAVNGVALWCDFEYGEGQTLSTGPVVPPVMGQKVEWNVNCRQAVYLTHTPCAVTPGYTLDFSVSFESRLNTLKFNWRF